MASSSGLSMEKVFLLLCIIAIGVSATYPHRRHRKLHHPSSLSNPKIESSTPREIPGYMLPSSLSPVHQLVRLQPFLSGNFSFNGYTELTFYVNSETTNITIHSQDLEIDTQATTLYETSDLQTPITIVDQTLDTQRQFYIATLGESLLQGSTYVLSLSFVGQLNGSLTGFYLSEYEELDGTVKYLAVTQFEATEAREAFPCFDEPDLKANFTTEIIREENFFAVSNMPISSSIPEPDLTGWVRDSFETSVIMPSYLNAYLVSEFSQKNSSVDDLMVRVWARDALIDTVDYSLGICHDITSYFEGYFNVPYVLPKQDQVAVPDFLYGAMENWGLITYAESRLLYQEDVSSANDKRGVCSIVGHELAHMWFGNLVTLEWWDYVWLNEGFATYYSFVGCDGAEPTFDEMDYILYEDLHYVFDVDDDEDSHPLLNEITNPYTIMSNFDSIAYSKGGSMVRMMEYFLTEASYVRGLEDYLNTYAYDNAVQDDLFEVLTIQALEDGTLRPDLTVKLIMDTWTLQMGYPVLTVIRAGDGTATLTQERFLMLPNPNSTDTHDYKWWIPVTYTTQTNPNFNQFTVTWMAPNESSIVISGLPATQDEWAIFNIQQGGYFRVNYDMDNWNAISDQLNSDHTVIHVLNRAQILNDAYNLAKAGRIGYEVPFSINAYLGNDVEYITLITSLHELNYIQKMFRKQSGYPNFKNYSMNILEPIYNDVGFDDSIQDPFVDQVRREITTYWSCWLGYEPCLSSSTDLYDQWMANPSDYTIISPNIKNTVYCTGIAEGNVVEWDFAFDRYLNATLPIEREKLIYAMGCSQESTILNRYLDMAFMSSSGIDQNDVDEVMEAVSVNIYGEDLAWQYIKNNDAEIASYMGSDQAVASYVNIVSIYFNTDQQLQELINYRDYFEQNFSGSTGEIDDAIERTQLNIYWMDSYYNTVAQWLLDNGY